MTDERNLQASDAFFRIFGMNRVEAWDVTECPRCGVGLVRDRQCSRCSDKFKNKWLGELPEETEEQRAEREKWHREHPTEPRNYRGVNWSEVG